MIPHSNLTLNGHQPDRLAFPRWIIFEGVVLLIAAPFLFFPDFLPIGTLAALVMLAFVWLFSLRSVVFPPTPFNLVILLLGVALMVGILTSADPAETLAKATGVILGLAVWRFMVVGIQTGGHVSLGVAGMLVAGISLSLLGVASLQGLVKIPLLADLNPFQGLGIQGLGGHINQVGGLICLYLPLLVSLSLFPPPMRHRQRLRIILVAATVVTAGILILSQSRSGWIGASAGVFLLLVLWGSLLPSSGERLVIRLAIAAVVVGGVTLILWVGPRTVLDLWLNPPQDTVVGTLTTLNYRKVLWPWAITAIGDFPFSGIGLGAFQQVITRLYPLPMSPDVDVSHAHNIFFQTALDVGLPGLIVYLALLFVTAAVGWQLARREDAFRTVSLGLLCGLASVHIYGLADAQVLGSKPGLVFWMALGLLAAMNKVDSLRAADHQS